MFRYSIFRNIKRNLKAGDEKESTNSPSNETPIKNTIQTNDRSLLLTRGYVLSNFKLGEGSYSKVKKAYSKYRDEDVAVKIINRKLAPQDFLDCFLPRELEVIGHLDHSNICRFYEVFDTGDKVYVFMEYANGGDLLDYIQKNKYINEDMAKNLFRQIVQAIKYLHERNILHRDLKCENILLTNNCKPLLTDFGFAKYAPEITDLNKTYCGSSAYAPVEILKGIPYDGQSSEVWSLGCILYIMTTGTMPFDDSNKAEQIKQMERGPTFYKTKQQITKTLRSLIVSMLELNANNRITVTSIEQHPWLAQRQKHRENVA